MILVLLCKNQEYSIQSKRIKRNELHNNYPLVLGKIEIKTEMLSEYQLRIVDLYNIPIGKVKKSVSIRKSKLALKLNKAAYIGLCIINLSKVLMYDFHDDYIKNKYGNKPKLLFTDTDSLHQK